MTGTTPMAKLLRRFLGQPEFASLQHPSAAKEVIRSSVRGLTGQRPRGLG